MYNFLKSKKFIFFLLIFFSILILIIFRINNFDNIYYFLEIMFYTDSYSECYIYLSKMLYLNDLINQSNELDPDGFKYVLNDYDFHLLISVDKKDIIQYLSLIIEIHKNNI